ncbi:MAG: tRNA (adenosine(37)-N6)-dimethylallyltransferase MiaA [Proteobacteria bacterium]|nr:tRNA (adenosine(37)-N6)-dimethylallyltransferase MiaA [Pseudomonadota bacterium]
MPRQAILLMGPTGAGKSDLALRLAQTLPLDIISVDSALIYRGMDIGTAKPTREELARAPHHLIDILDPAQSYSAGEFLRDAEAAMREIWARGRVPLLVGGTMLYFHALSDGIADLPPGDRGLRAEIEQQAARQGWAALHAELARVDATAAARIKPSDPQRIQRALEVFQLTGRPISELQQVRRAPFEQVETHQFVLAPTRRAALHERIEGRFERMMAQGFLEEVEALRRRGDLTLSHASMRCVGYRQLWQHLEGAFDLEEAVHRGVIATRQLAKRQWTWLRRRAQAQWLDPEQPETAQSVIFARLIREENSANTS